MSAYSVEVNSTDLLAVQTLLRHAPKAFDTALVRATNRGLTKGRTTMVNETADRLNLKKKRIRQDITIGKASKFRMRAWIKSKGKPVNLEAFGSRQTKKGVSVQVLKANPRYLVRHAWIGLGANANKILLRREKTEENAPYYGTKRPNPNLVYSALPEEFRYPLESLTGPRVQDITDNPEVIGAVQKEASETISEELKRQTDLFLRKYA